MTPSQRAQRRAENAKKREPLNLGPCLFRTYERRAPYGGRKGRAIARKWRKAANALAQDWSHPEQWPES